MSSPAAEHVKGAAVGGLYRQARRAALSGIALSLGLGILKLLGGYFGHSVALLSDAAHSLVDAILSGTLLAALHVAERPADREHPYGHTRIETVAGTVVALLMIVMSVAIVWEAVRHLAVPSPVPEAYTVAIAAIGAVFQEGLFHYARAISRRTGSGALLATAWDFRLDALGSLVVLAGVSLAHWGGPRFHWADHAAAVVVALTIFGLGARLLQDSVQELMDRQASPELLQAVRRESLQVPGVLGVETLRVRKTGLEYLVDIHVEVDPELTVRAGHEIAHAVKDRVRRNVVAVRDVLVHIEPFPGPRERR
jgi:cation diffusion facilitator family transporter